MNKENTNLEQVQKDIYTEADANYMKQAISQAKIALKHGEVPIGCVIVYDGEIIGRGYNRRNTDKCTLSHAEITAIKRASKKLNDWRLEECTMYVTLEPCQMCAGAIVQARIPKVIGGATSPKAGCAGSILNILENNEFNHQVDYSYGLLADDCTALLKSFFRGLRLNSRKEKLHTMNECQNIIFDIDGTLWNTTEIVAEAWNNALSDVGLEPTLGRFITGEMLTHEFGKPMDVIVNDLFPNQDEETQIAILDKVKYHEEVVLRKCDANLAYPDVTSTIAKLAENHKLFIVSNCQDGYISIVMEKLGITEYITDFESFGKTGLSKGDNIKLVMKRNKLASGSTYYVGDTSGDYESTKQACIPFIHAKYGFESFGEDYSGLSIEKFSDLLSI